MNGEYLPKIKKPADIKELSEKELPLLAKEIRGELINTISENGGHLASNLGVVELTIALHRIFNSPNDKIIWDVSHQSYVHKLLTGRADRFYTIRQPGGISGFTRRSESEHDIMSGGHSSVALSAAYGIAAANRIKGKKDYTIAVVGDGAFTGGMVYEALNNAGKAGAGTRLIVILNDNEMSISPNVGALARLFAQMKANPRYFRLKARTENVLNHIPVIGKAMTKTIYDLKKHLKDIIYKSNMFEDLGFRYIGPIDGHNIGRLCSALEGAKEADFPVVLHINTVKGKGYEYAEKSPDTFHGCASFDLISGEPRYAEKSYSDIFGEYILSAAGNDKRICCITAAMSIGTGLEPFKKAFPNRFFDVGIAEQHAVTFAAGLARGGMLPVFAVYSSFLQRSYDQLLHDCAMQKLKIVFAIDRAGFVGLDGESHHGIFDAAFLNTIPGITVMSPSNFSELKNCLCRALYHTEGPVAVRYPRGVESKLPVDFENNGEDFCVYGDIKAKTAIVTYGKCFSYAARAKNLLCDTGIDSFVIKLNTIKPISPDAVKTALHCEYIFFFEEGQRLGGVGEVFSDMLFSENFLGKFVNTAVEDEFSPQDSVKGLYKKYRLDTEGIINTVTEVYNDGKDKA